eukprot:CAMPEP_0184694144 /NCGR_PEP_ID=MMETSP0313-20130426/2192_1 /TAXON_ID=2792 /ORGANISM="Porphyridium aerugineum, Strain SAG 1380-2" /LENGTH=700 /DNA_ID=CAMNT_0027152381 /DNA_START=44 /DNA_END=2143 /DNA_ORIENTATION=+
MKPGIGRKAPTWIIVMLCAILGLCIPFAYAATLPHHETHLKLYDSDGNMIEPQGEALARSQRLLMERVGHRVIRTVNPKFSEDDITLPEYRTEESKQAREIIVVYGFQESEGTVTNTSEFRITIEGPNGLPDSLPAMKAAFQVVANGWTSNVPVKVRVHFAQAQGYLMVGQPTLSYLMDDVYYPAAIYDYITGKDNDVGRFDIDIEINPTANWSIEDGTLSSTNYDFQSVIIHEAQHGLYLWSNFGVLENGQGTLIEGKQMVFDKFVAVNPTRTSDTSKICSVIGYFDGNTNLPSKEVELALTSNRLFFMVDTLPASGYYNLYAPGSFVPGSSVIHVDTFVSQVFDECDTLMNYLIAPGTSTRCIGKITSRISFACRTVGLNNGDFIALPPCVPGSFLTGEPTSTPDQGTESPSFPPGSPSSVPPSVIPSPLPSTSPTPSEIPEASITPVISEFPSEFDSESPVALPEGSPVALPEGSPSENPSGSPSQGVEESFTVSPSESAVESPTPSSSGDSNTNSDPCFPADAVVQLSSGRSARMDELDIGDRVLVGDNKYSDVYLFGHRVKPSDDNLFTFVRLILNTDELTVELSGTHLVWANQQCCKPAGDVKLGDELLDVSSGKWIPVIRIERVRKPGLYNPHTMTGDIVVNGVLVSTYNRVVHPTLGHWLLAPERWMYELTKGRTSLLNRCLELKTPAVLQW